MLRGISPRLSYSVMSSLFGLRLTVAPLSCTQGAASMSGRKITILRQSGAACDHPIDPSYPEGAYLSNVLLRVH